MAAVINGGSVHEDEVLVDPAAPHAESRRSFARGLDARHHLDDADDVGFAHQGREFLDKSGVDPLQPHLGQLDFLAFRPGENGRGFQLAWVCPQVEIQAGAFGEIDGMFSGADAEGIETDGIGGDPGLLGFQVYDGLGEGFAALRIPDISGKGDLPLLGTCKQGRQQKEKGQECPVFHVLVGIEQNSDREDTPII